MFGVLVLKVKVSFDTNAQDAQVLLDEVADLYDVLTLMQAATLNNGYQVYIEAYDSATEMKSLPSYPVDTQAEDPNIYTHTTQTTIPLTTVYNFHGEPAVSWDLNDLDIDKRLIK
jgi:hypothetical protein